MPTPTAPDPLESATAESADALATMESEAADFFAARDAERAAKALGASQPLNPVAPALEKAAREAAGKPPEKAAAPAAQPAPAKVPGAPALKKAEPAKAEAARPADTKPAPDFSDVPREYTPGKTRAPQWDKLHAKADHYEALSTQRHQEIEDLRAQLEAARAATANGTPSAEVAQRLQTLQSERDALRAQLEAVAGERIFDVESKPRREAALYKAKQAVAPSDIKNIEMLLQTPGSAWREEQLNSIMAGLTPLRATQLANAVADWDGLDAEREAARARGGEIWKSNLSAQQAQQERANAERIARAASTFDAELKEWEVAGVTAEEAAAARSVYTGQNATLQDASRAALWGAVGPRVASQLVEAQGRIAELEGELSKLRSAQPGVGAAASGALPTEPTDDDDPSATGYAERIARQAMRAGLRFGAG